MEIPAVAQLLEPLPEPLLQVDPGNRIRVANQAARDTLGEGLVGRSVYSVIRQPEAVEALEKGLVGRGGQGTRTEARFVTVAGGVETVFRMVVSPVAPETGLQGAVVSFLDVSHIEEAEQMRRDFVANVSHELRSPLTVLTGFIETLRGPARDDPAAAEKFLGIMEQEAQRMNRLIGDLLSLSRVEQNERVRPRDRIRLGDIIDSTLAALRPQIEEDGVEVDFERGAGEHYVTGDRDQLIQVFHNLVENAIKYGGAGGRVTIAAHEKPKVPGMPGPVVAVEVTDEGDGIAAAHLPRLTERFYRVDTHRSREMGGTGLGLAIVKHIVNRHRGRLSIRSERGKGSTFTVFLPAAG